MTWESLELSFCLFALKGASWGGQDDSITPPLSSFLELRGDAQGIFFFFFLWTTQDGKKRCEGKEEKEVKKGQWILYSVVVPKQRACNLIQVKSREDIFHQLQCKCNLKAGTSTCSGTYYEQWSLYVVVVVVVMRNFLSWNIPETRSKTSANVVEIGRWRVRYLWPAPYMGCWIMWLVALIRPLYNWGGGKEKRKHHNQVSCRN